jgi:DNA-binding CsgD family transcriptional regulator
MSSLTTASEADLCRLAAIVTAKREDLPPQGLPLSLLSDLMDQIRCDGLSFAGFDSAGQDFWFCQGLPEDDGISEQVAEAALQALWQHYWDSTVCNYPDRTGDLRRVLKPADFYSDRQWRSTGMYTENCRPQGIRHMLTLFLPEPPGPTRGPGRTIRLYLFRDSGPDFSERDRALLTLIRPHLHQAYLDAERRRTVQGSRLTTRQSDLLALVADGHTNSQIARRLGLSEGTVRTHLENIYGRLQVSSRTAAVLRAFPDRTL